MKALLIGSGQYIDYEKLKIEVDLSDIVIAVDGGINYLNNIDIIPDVFIGDQDSANIEIIQNMDLSNTEIYKFQSEKDMTDMDLAIDYIYERKYDEVVIFGGTGTRLDHTLANMFLLNKLDEFNILGKIIDCNNEIVIVKNKYVIKDYDKAYVSIVPISDQGVWVNLINLKYPLDNYHIEFGSTIGISNEMLDGTCIVEVIKGKAFLFVSID